MTDPAVPPDEPMNRSPVGHPLDPLIAHYADETDRALARAVKNLPPGAYVAFDTTPLTREDAARMYDVPHSVVWDDHDEGGDRAALPWWRRGRVHVDRYDWALPLTVGRDRDAAWVGVLCVWVRWDRW